MAAGLVVWKLIPTMASEKFGPSSQYLTSAQEWEYSLRVLVDEGKLVNSSCTENQDIQFSIGMGNSVNQISNNLESAGIIVSAAAFRNYLIYKGYDTQIRAGEYKLSCRYSAVQVAEKIKNNFSFKFLEMVTIWSRMVGRNSGHFLCFKK